MYLFVSLTDFLKFFPAPGESLKTSLEGQRPYSLHFYGSARKRSVSSLYRLAKHLSVMTAFKKHPTCVVVPEKHF